MSDAAKHEWVTVGRRRVCRECGMELGPGKEPRWVNCYGVCIQCGGFGFYRVEHTDRIVTCTACPTRTLRPCADS